MLGETVAEAARRFQDLPALVAPEGWTVSYSDLDRLSDEAAAGLVRRGIRPGDVVALALPAIPEYMVAYLATAKAGAVTTGVNPRLSPAERSAVLDVADPRLLLATADLVPARGRAIEVEEVIPVAETGSCDRMLAALRLRGESPAALPDDPERPVVIVFTSGTTGAPRGALFCNRQLSAVTAIEIGDVWGGGGSQLASTALTHLGPMTKLDGSLRRGITTFLTYRWHAKQALAFIEDHRVTTVGGIPTQLALMLQVPEFDIYDLSSIKAIVIGGGPATPALVREARARFNAPLAIRYSCTEAAIGIGTALDGPEEDAEVSVGRPLRGVSMALLDSEDRPVSRGQVGSVCLRSAAVMCGYYRDPEATKAAFTADRYVRTGDLGFLDDKGRLRLAGRSKEMYVRGGYNVYPMEVEGVLSDHPSVAEVAVVPRPDPIMGEVGVAVVVPHKYLRPPSLEELRSFSRDRLASYKLPEDLRVVDALPLTSMEKVDRKTLAGLLTRLPRPEARQARRQ